MVELPKVDGAEVEHALKEAARERILVLDGAMGTMIQALGLDEAAFRGARFDAWNREVEETLAEATLKRPAAAGHVPRGKEGLHSEHLGYLLAELQVLARAHPGASW